MNKRQQKKLAKNFIKKNETKICDILIDYRIKLQKNSYMKIPENGWKLK